MSASREAQQIPLSLQGETQMSKCVIDRLVHRFALNSQNLAEKLNSQTLAEVVNLR